MVYPTETLAADVGWGELGKILPLGLEGLGTAVTGWEHLAAASKHPVLVLIQRGCADAPGSGQSLRSSRAQTTYLATGLAPLCRYFFP